MTNKIEKRVTISKLECRNGADGFPEISGIAAAYNCVSQDLGGFVEVIAPGAFANVLRSPGLDVRCLMNHDPNMVLGRTKSGTLKLWETDRGLCFQCALPDTQVARDLRESILRGDMDSCSFAFKLGEGDDEYSSYTTADGKRTQLRTIRNFSGLFDVSAVTYPAYPTGTAVSARSLAAYDIRRVDTHRVVSRDPEHNAMLQRAIARINLVKAQQADEDAALRAHAHEQRTVILADDTREGALLRQEEYRQFWHEEHSRRK